MSTYFCLICGQVYSADDKKEPCPRCKNDMLGWYEKIINVECTNCHYRGDFTDGVCPQCGTDPDDFHSF